MYQSIGSMDLFRIIKSKWLLIVLFFIVGVSGAYLWSTQIMQPMYQSETRMLVNRPIGTGTGQEAMDLQDIETNIQLINTYRDIIEDPVILQEVQEKINWNQSYEDLKNNIEVQIQEESQIFTIESTAASPEQAAKLADTVAEVFRDNVGSIMRVENVAILSPALVNKEPVSPNVPLNIIIGGIAGALAGFILAVGSTVFNTKLSDEIEMTELLGWTYLGAVSEVPKKELKKSDASQKLTNSSVSEQPRVAEGGQRHV